MTMETSIGNPVALEELDLRLIELLESDPLASQTTLAASLGVSRPTIGAMLQRLIDARVIETVCLVDHLALGYKNSVFFGINAVPGCLLDVADKLASLAPIHYVALCVGPFDIVSWGVFKGPRDILDFLTGDFGKIRGLSHYETIMCQEIKISPALIAESRGYQLKECRASLDHLDLALIGALQRNSRESAAGLAAKLGTSKPTALRRTRRLLGEGVIRFVTMVNPFSLGYKGHASIGIKASPDRVKDVAEAVAALRSVQTVALCTGRYDVLAWTVFREQRDLMDSLTEEIGKIPGILSTETTISLKTVKSSYISVDRHSGLWGSLD